MALTYYTKKVARPEELYEDREGHLYPGPILTRIVFGTMATGMNTITKTNYREWWMRYEMWRRLHCLDDAVDLAMVKRFIGLRTNASPETFAQFRKRHLDGLWSDLKWESSKADEKLTDEAVAEVTRG